MRPNLKKKNLPKSILTGLVNNAWDPHKKRGPFTNTKAFCIQTNTKCEFG